MPKFVFYLYLIPLVVGAMISLKIFGSSWPRFFRLFSFFLVGTLLMEIFAISWKFWLHETAWWHFSTSNLWVYDIYYVPQYLLYYIFFYKSLEVGMVGAKTFLAVCTVVAVGGLFNLFFMQGINKLNTYTIILGSLGVIFFCFNYFKQESLRRKPEKAVRDPLFWISSGAFIFHTAALPYFVFINYLSKYNIKLALALFSIILFLNIFMYSMYLIALLCNRPLPRKQY